MIKRSKTHFVPSHASRIFMAILCIGLLTVCIRPAQAQPRWVGVDMPWIAYGADFGMDFYFPGYGPSYNGATWDAYFADIQSKHMNIVRIWTMEDFSGLSFQNNDPNQPCTGVSQDFINNLSDFVQRANNHGITAYVTFLTGGDIVNHPNVVTTYRSQFINNALVPVAQALNGKQVMYDLMNECNYSGLGWGDLRNFGNDARIALHNVNGNWVTMSTDQASAFAAGNFYNTLGGLGFDFYDCHCYSTDGSPLGVTPAQVNNAPLFVGEWGPPGNGWSSYSDSQNQSTVNNFCNDANNKGYSGMLAWSYVPGNGYSLQNTSEYWTYEYYANQWLPLISGNRYVIVNQFSGMALDDTNWSTSPGTIIQQWDNWGGPPQQWTCTGFGGVYNIVNAYSGEALDDSGWGTSNGTWVDQWTSWGGPPQSWQVVPVGDGSCQVLNFSGLALDDYGWSTTHGGWIDLWQNFNNPNQHWIFQPSS